MNCICKDKCDDINVLSTPDEKKPEEKKVTECFTRDHIDLKVNGAKIDQDYFAFKHDQLKEWKKAYEQKGNVYILK